MQKERVIKMIMVIFLSQLKEGDFRAFERRRSSMRGSAPSHQKESAEVVLASDFGASWIHLFGCLSGMSHWEDPELTGLNLAIPQQKLENSLLITVMEISLRMINGQRYST